jgi:hypothetical protein
MRKMPLELKNKIMQQKQNRYNLLLLHKDPSSESLDYIGPACLGIYLKKESLYCKVIDKEEKEIILCKNARDTPQCIETGTYFRLKKSIEENVTPNIDDKMELVEWASAIGYTLPEYKVNIVLSPYDHCLTEEEAEEQILSYAIPLKPNQKKKYLENEAKFIDFYKKIYTNYSTFFAFCDKFSDTSEEFYEFESQDELEKICLASLREQRFIDLYVEKLGLLISGAYDLEVLLYANDLSAIETLQQQDFMEGLYLLR